MYLSHFGLAEEPFNITSDPKFLWMSPQHEEAFAHLLYAIQQRKGFAVLSGDIGTGKTTLVNCVLNRIDKEIKTAVVYNSSLNTDELFQYLFRDFDIPHKALNRADSIIALNDWLLVQAENDANAVIIIDEAQNLSLETMEDLRLLSNLETAQKKLLQIILVGQPELNDKLADPSLYQLQQRIAIRFNLHAFTAAETQQYVKHRLGIAGGEASRSILDMGALKVVFEISTGIPRVINQICDTALLKAYSQGLKSITADFMRTVADQEFAHRKKQPRKALAAVDSKTTASSSLLTTRSVLFLCFNAALIFFLFRFLNNDSPVPTVNAEQQQAMVQMKKELASAKASMNDLQVKLQQYADRPFKPSAGEKPAATKRVGKNAPEKSKESTITERPNGRTDFTLIRIRQNDTLMKIVKREYGTADWNRVDQILKLNPGIKNPNLIRIGDQIRVPKF